MNEGGAARRLRPPMLDLRVPTPKAWLDVVFADFDAFLVDHARCERKASAMGMSLVAKYPDRVAILDPLIAFSREELEHFHVMYRIVEKRGLRLVGDEKDAYVNALRKLSRSGGDDLFAHFKEIQGASGFKSLAEGQKVQYIAVRGPKGMQATKIQPL